MLNEHLNDTDKKRLVATLVSCRPPDGKKAGFGGGPGQIPHLAPSYAAVMSLAYMCRTRAEWDVVIDRSQMHDWLLSLRQEDGSFVMHQDGEVDVRSVQFSVARVYKFENVKQSIILRFDNRRPSQHTLIKIDR